MIERVKMIFQKHYSEASEKVGGSEPDLNENFGIKIDHPFAKSFFYLYTAASLGHSRARSQLAIIYLQNGLIPSKTILRQEIYGAKFTDFKGEFAFLEYVSPDIMKLVNDETLSEVEYMKHTV